MSGRARRSRRDSTAASSADDVVEDSEDAASTSSDDDDRENEFPAFDSEEDARDPVVQLLDPIDADEEADLVAKIQNTTWTSAKINQLKKAELIDLCNQEKLAIKATDTVEALKSRLLTHFKISPGQVKTKKQKAQEQKAAEAARWKPATQIRGIRQPFTNMVNGEHPTVSPALHLTIDSTPLEYFNKFITPEFRQQLVAWSNTYANMHDFAHKYKTHWVPLSLAQLDKYLAMLIHNGTHPQPNWDSYWSSSEIIR